MALEVTCRACGVTAPDGGEFCAACGTRHGAAARVSGPTVDPADPSRPAIRRDQLLERLARATLGTYEIRGEIGRGGMAAVFYAHDLRMDRKVAIKVMFPDLIDREGMVRRFDQEVRTAAKLLHPHITVIHSVGGEEDLHYFVMSLVEGLALAQLLRAPTTAAPLPVPLAQSLLVQVARALHYAHGRGVVHRDVTPTNVMVDTSGDAVIMDFGIAKVLEAPSLTQTGVLIGTPTYMSPEQCRGEAVTAASDQYSLGVLAFEVLAGRPPFVTGNPMALLLQHVQAEPPPLRALQPDVPPALADAVMRMLAKRPEDRWPSLRDAVPMLSTGFDEHDEAPRQALARLVAAAGPVDRTRFAPTPVTPFAPARSARADTPAADQTARYELEVGASLAPLTGAAALGEQVLGWRVGDPAVAAVAPDGTITATGPGQTTVHVVLRPERPGAPEAQRAVAVLTVVPARVARVVLTPQSVSVRAGEATSFDWRVEDAAGGALAGRRVHWSSSNPEVATVDESGVVTGLTPGRATISAACEECVASAAVVVARSLHALSATPAALDLTEGDTETLALHGTDAAGAPCDPGPIRWTSTRPDVATVNGTGRVSAVGPGTATIEARAEDGPTAATVATVHAAHVVAIELAPPARPLRVGRPQRLPATARDARGRALAGRALEWSTRTPELVRVDADGAITGLAPGAAEVEAACEGARAVVTLEIVPAPRRARWLVPLGATLAAGVLAALFATRAPVGPRRHADSAATAAATRSAVEPQRDDSAAAAQAQQPSPDAAQAGDSSQLLAARADSADSASARATRDSIAKANARVVVSIVLPNQAPARGVLWARDTATLFVRVDTAGRGKATLSGTRVVWGTSDPSVLSFTRGLATTGRPGTVMVTASLGKSQATSRSITVASRPAVAAAAAAAEPPESAGARGPALLDEAGATAAVDDFARRLESGPYGDVLTLPAAPSASTTAFRDELLKWMNDGGTIAVRRPAPPSINRDEHVVRFELAVERRKAKKAFGVVRIGSRSDRRLVEFRGRPEFDRAHGWTLHDVVLTAAPKP